ncbi:odorant receptor 10 isoform X1 [Megalopta genalis]|uniref:odorant receptor 10 isoform X1 n=1 Tax=Megalopta genalis TaxID=115081 RepID=UPI0014434111|nr:odorant receptor 30a-like isoform X2 [Megalopta genalis]
MVTSKQIHEADYDWAVGISRNCLRLICLWPRESCGKRKLLDNLCVMTIVLTFSVFVVIPSVLLLLKQNDLKTIIDDGSYCIAALSLVPKFLIIHGKRSVILNVLNMMAIDWEKSKTDEEKNIMFYYANIARVGSILGFTFGFIAIFLITILPKFGIQVRHTEDGLDMFPYPCYYVFDVSRSPYYEIIYTIQIFMMALILLSYIGIHMFFGTLFLHICGQAKNLRARIENEKKFEDFRRTMTSIVSDHLRVIRMVKMIESTFSQILVTMIIIFGVITCAYLTSIISMFAESDTISLTRLSYLVFSICTNLVQMLFYFLTGQELANQSEGIYDATYECGWLNLKSNEAKSLILVMVRSQKPLIVTAGKLFPVTFLTFGGVMKLSFSYVSFLLTML